MSWTSNTLWLVLFINFFQNYEAAAVAPKNGNKVLDPQRIKKHYQKIEFGLRGPIYHRTFELMDELEKGGVKPFKTVLPLHIADSQAVGQKPITFIRQLVAAASLPELANTTFPSDVGSRLAPFLNELHGHSIGALPNVQGTQVVRQAVADYITNRDGFKAEASNIYLVSGVSVGAGFSFQLIERECQENSVGVMVPVPLYPLYSVILEKYGMYRINYRLDPANKWAIDLKELERSYDEAAKVCNCEIRVFVLISPGNPSGRIMRQDELTTVVKFAHDKKLILIADEIYQHNILSDIPFISLRKTALGMGDPYDKVEMINLYSVSKGFASEAGLRGGFIELVNMDKGVNDVLFKLVGTHQASGNMGQVGLLSIVNAPKEGDPSYPLYRNECDHNIHSLREIGNKICNGLNLIEGFHCNDVEGGAILFPEVKLPTKAITEAEAKGVQPDLFYGLQLLEEYGIAVAVGSAFGMPPVPTYLRITIPGGMAMGDDVLTRIKEFSSKFNAKYA